MRSCVVGWQLGARPATFGSETVCSSVFAGKEKDGSRPGGLSDEGAAPTSAVRPTACTHSCPAGLVGPTLENTPPQAILTPHSSVLRHTLDSVACIYDSVTESRAATKLSHVASLPLPRPRPEPCRGGPGRAPPTELPCMSEFAPPNPNPAPAFGPLGARVAPSAPPGGTAAVVVAPPPDPPPLLDIPDLLPRCDPPCLPSPPSRDLVRELDPDPGAPSARPANDEPSELVLALPSPPAAVAGPGSP